MLRKPLLAATLLAPLAAPGVSVAQPVTGLYIAGAGGANFLQREKPGPSSYFGFRPGYVHFSARGPKGTNVIRFLREHAPPGVDQGYGNGHDQASGGAVPVESWNAFIEDLGFGPEMML